MRSCCANLLIWLTLIDYILTVVLQVGTLKEIQRLYDELIESEMACRLDRYDASEKELR